MQSTETNDIGSVWLSVFLWKSYIGNINELLMENDKL